MLKEHGYIPLKTTYFAYKKSYREYLELISEKKTQFLNKHPDT